MIKARAVARGAVGVVVLLAAMSGAALADFKAQQKIGVQSTTLMSLELL